MADNSGWVKSWRKSKNWRYYKDSEHFHLWHHLLYEANHSDKIIHDGYFNKISKGQFSTSIRRLSNETGISIAKVRRILKNLEIDTQISTLKTSKCSIITILNWDDYQGHDTESETQTTRRQHAGDTRTRIKELKEDIYSSNFLAIWEKYPRKVAKKPAAKAFKKIPKRDHEKFTLAVENYTKAVVGKDQEHILHMATFINQERWEEFLDWNPPPDPDKQHDDTVLKFFSDHGSKGSPINEK